MSMAKFKMRNDTWFTVSAPPYGPVEFRQCLYREEIARPDGGDTYKDDPLRIWFSLTRVPRRL